MAEPIYIGTDILVKAFGENFAEEVHRNHSQYEEKSLKPQEQGW